MIKVLVTGVGGGGVGRQIVKALRLAKTPYYIVGVDAVRSSLFDVDAAVNVPRALDPRYRDSLLSVCAKNHVDVVIPGTEVELKVLSDNRRRFANEGILLLVNSAEVIDIGLNKWNTMGSHLFSPISITPALYVQRPRRIQSSCHLLADYAYLSKRSSHSCRSPAGQVWEPMRNTIFK